MLSILREIVDDRCSFEMWLYESAKDEEACQRSPIVDPCQIKFEDHCQPCSY